MIQLLPCPACHQSTVLPEGVVLESTIQCPHCGEQFVMGELLTDRYKSWLVTDDSLRPNAGIAAPAHFNHEASSASDAEQPANEDRLGEYAGIERAADKGESKGDEVQGDEVRLQAAHNAGTASKKPKADWSNFEPITHEQFERMRRQSRSPLWSMLQIVLGGLAAIPISLLLVWHLIGTDVAGAGPVVGRYLPWIVPEKFRPYRNSLNDSLVDSNPGASNAPAPGESGFRRFDDVLRKSQNGEDSQSPPPEMADIHDDVNSPLAESAEAPPTLPADAPTSGRTTRKPTSEPTSEPPMGPAEAGGSETASPPTAVPSGNTEAGNIFAIIRKSIADLDDWSRHSEGENVDRRAVAQRVYGDLIALAASLDSLPKGNRVIRTVRNELQPIGRRVLLQADVQEVVRQGARFWLQKHASDDRFPLALIAEIRRVDEARGSWLVEPTAETQLSFGSTPLEIEIPQVLAPSLIAGQKLLLLGVVQVEPPPSAASEPDPASASDAESDAEENIPSATISAPHRPVFSANYLYGLAGAVPEPEQTSRSGND